MAFLIPLKKLLPYWLIGLILFLLLSACGPSRTPDLLNPVIHSGDPTPELHSTPSPVSTHSADDLLFRRFADTWNNIHSFLTFDYNISNAANIAKHYDFVWGASVNHIAAFRSGNPNIFLTYYIPFHRDSGLSLIAQHTTI